MFIFLGSWIHYMANMRNYSLYRNPRKGWLYSQHYCRRRRFYSNRWGNFLLLRSWRHSIYMRTVSSYLVQGQLRIWTEHSTLIFENLKPVEKSKNHFNIIYHLQKFNWFSKLRGRVSKIKAVMPILVLMNKY